MSQSRPEILLIRLRTDDRIGPWRRDGFERLIWKYRLISIVPVELSLLGSVGCFVIGAFEVFNAFFVIMRLPFTTKSVAAKTIAQMVGGVDYFVSASPC